VATSSPTDAAQRRVHGASPAFDRAALEALYVRLERPLYNVVHRRLWNAEDSMDVVQEAFVRLWNARDRILPETAEAFAWRTVLNLASNR
jgi:RNA polymerase sigma-70 factor (ECF subfamily)